MLRGNKLIFGEVECIKLINKGDKAAFEHLFDKYNSELFRFANSYVRSQAKAENIVQEVFLKVWEQREQLNSAKSISSFLYQSVRNKALDNIKHENIVREKLALFKKNKEENLPEFSSFNKKKFLSIAQDQIEKLPSKTRRIYKLSRNEGLTYREIGDVEEISPKAVEYHITKALKILRNNLQKAEFYYIY